jgi:NAD(P)-dependent dehydrogenase (short-subunit alcohol dehydrogenase family)
MESIIITGANSGIGYECAWHLASMAPNQQVILACRNTQAGNEALRKIKAQTGHGHLVCLALDLGDWQSIRDFAAAFSTLPEVRIAALINNAGLQKVGKISYTKDGLEETFGVNHLGPLYLTLLLLPYLSEHARITFTASGTHDPKQKTGMPAPKFQSARLLAFPENSTDTALSIGQQRYTTSKLCNVLTVYELQRRLAHTHIHVNAFDPGLVPGTGLAKNYPPVLKFLFNNVFKVMRLLHPNVHTAKKSGMRLANLAYGAAYQNAKGKYFEGEKEIPSSVGSYNQSDQKELWDSSMELLGITPQELPDRLVSRAER